MKKKKSQRLHKNMWSIHNWVGLYAGVVIAVLSITGVVALFKVEIDETVNSRLFQVSPPKDKIKVDVSPIIDSLRNIYSPSQIHVTVPRSDKDVWIVRVGINKSRLNIKQWQIFIHPYTGKIIGERDNYKSIGYFIRNLHVRLYEGLIGRYLVGIAGLALLISTITGFWIYGGFMKKQFFAVIRTKNLRIKMADYHKLIGIATLAFNLMIAVTGTWLGLQGLIQEPIMGGRPGIFKTKSKPITKAQDAAYFIDYRETYDKSRQQFPELEPKYMIPSTDGSRTIQVYGDVPRTAFERHHFRLTLDKKEFKEIHRLDIREKSLGTKLFYIQESMHFGDWGGIWLKILYAFFGIVSGFLALTGFIVYLKRTEKTRKENPKFIELKPLLLRWTYAILSIILLLYILNSFYGIVVPSLLIIISLYLSIMFLLIRAVVLFVKRKLKNKIYHE